MFTNMALAQNTILWSIQYPDSDVTSHILGTYHQMGNSFVDDKPLIQELVGTSDIVVFECIEDRQEKIIDVMLSRTDDFSYQELLYKDDVEFLENYTKDWSVPLSKQKPGEFIFKFLQEIGKKYCGTIEASDTSDHMDNYILSMAGNHNVPVYGLESVADQMRVINATEQGELTWDQAKERIHWHIENLKNQHYDCRLARQYMKMKLDYQFKTKCVEDDVMLTKRNETWMPQIRLLLEEHHSVFIVVGLSHLFYDCGIISQLRKEGFIVKEVNLKG
jgi:uncharacterized protein YbaP (TraB family)